MFYCGNEANIFTFYNTSGFQSETLAQKFNGIVIYAEHRYFGESIPSTDKSRSYLTLENAMMDYANLIAYLRQKYQVHNVITFGGSYGGMLASWMRIKFPSLVQAAVVSGGPILYFKDSVEAPETIFYSWVNQIYASMGKLENGKCPTLINEGLTNLQIFSDDD